MRIVSRLAYLAGRLVGEAHGIVGRRAGPIYLGRGCARRGAKRDEWKQKTDHYRRARGRRRRHGSRTDSPTTYVSFRTIAICHVDYDEISSDPFVIGDSLGQLRNARFRCVSRPVHFAPVQYMFIKRYGICV